MRIFPATEQNRADRHSRRAVVAAALFGLAASAALPVATAHAATYQPCSDRAAIRAAGFDPATMTDAGSDNAAGCRFTNGARKLWLFTERHDWADEAGPPANPDVHVTPIAPIDGHQAVRWDGPAFPGACFVILRTSGQPFKLRLDAPGDACSQAVAATKLFASKV